MLGPSFEDLLAAKARAAGTTVGDIATFLGGKEFAANNQIRLMDKLGGIGAGGAPTAMGRVARMAASKPVGYALRAVPGLSAGLLALDAADIVANDTNILNKGMDATAMGIGAVLGSVAGPLGAMGGASLGKMTSDGLQYLFGDKKTPKQRELENALAALNAGRIG